jgi:hypothetical protein
MRWHIAKKEHGFMIGGKKLQIFLKKWQNALTGGRWGCILTIMVALTLMFCTAVV